MKKMWWIIALGLMAGVAAQAAPRAALFVQNQAGAKLENQLDAFNDLVSTRLSAAGIETIRAQDVLARYGGEEFVLLLPDTAVAQGVEILQRLQRELTQRFFLANNDKVLITFSAGVAQVHASETGMAALQRADQAMYLAKRNGKNRVLAA